MKQSIKAFIEEIKKLKNEAKSNLTDIAKSKDVTSSFDNQISEEEFMEAMKDHCKKEKEKSCPY
ncbi:MAG: hypothetical protein GX895_07225, partial [Clostridiales bacterium]|nr:hypothetical protein [Clostridiales bacterium]